MNHLQQTSCKACAHRREGIFCDLHEHKLGELDRIKSTQRFSRGEILFSAGNRPAGIFCVAEGKIKIYKSDASGNQKIVRIASVGDVVGYRSILAKEDYTATAETLENTLVCFIERTAFEKLLNDEPFTVFRLMGRMAEEIRDAQNNEFSLAHKTVRARLAELLLILSSKYGEAIHSKIHLQIKLTRQEIADIIGTTQETAIRTIRDFQEIGLIELVKRDIYVIDRTGLLETAGLNV